MKQKLLFAVAGISLIAAAGIYFVTGAQPPKPVETAQEAKVHPIHDDATFEKETKVQGFMPYGKSELEYEVKVPKNWEADEDMGAKAKLEEDRAKP